MIVQHETVAPRKMHALREAPASRSCAAIGRCWKFRMPLKAKHAIATLKPRARRY